MSKTIEQIAKEDGRFNAKAMVFIHNGLGVTIQRVRDAEGIDTGQRHLTGAELATGLARLAQEKWGRMAKMVLNNWGVKTTRDMGEIVYLMIENKLMSAQETDTIEDFDNVYDFEEVFEKKYNFDID